jgi:pyruvate dehydrogenase E2 component (dihydrolipoamide acetyltransferase)
MPTIEVRVPDIGDFKDVPIIEVHVKPGDAVKREESLVTLESDKATFDIPAPSEGTVREMGVKVGDRVSEGSLVLTLEAVGSAPSPRPSPPLRGGEGEEKAAAEARAAAPPPVSTTVPPHPAPLSRSAGERVNESAAAEPPRAGVAHASPSIRRFARELGVALSRVEGTGPRGRILREDVSRFVSAELGRESGAGAGRGLDLLPWPRVDFARFGPIERTPLARIRRISAANLARNWVMIPHVTQHDEADVTDLEAFRVRLNAEEEGREAKVTLLAFVVKACLAALRRFPEFNASLDGDDLVLKRYFHIGFAADTPNGLVVPVLRDADRKGVLEIARELATLAAKAREGKLGPAEMQGGTFSISSLGGIGGTAFTPIINAPEVAILGVSRTSTRPVWDGKAFAPRLLLPLSLSYDHRVIDGAAAARFTAFLAQALSDVRRAML